MRGGTAPEEEAEGVWAVGSAVPVLGGDGADGEGGVGMFMLESDGMFMPLPESEHGSSSLPSSAADVLVG